MGIGDWPPSTVLRNRWDYTFKIVCSISVAQLTLCYCFWWCYDPWTPWNVTLRDLRWQRLCPEKWEDQSLTNWTLVSPFLVFPQHNPRSHVMQSLGTMRTQPVEQTSHTRALVAMATLSAHSSTECHKLHSGDGTGVPLRRIWIQVSKDNLCSFDFFMKKYLDQRLLRPQWKSVSIRPGTACARRGRGGWRGARRCHWQFLSAHSGPVPSWMGYS